MSMPPMSITADVVAGMLEDVAVVGMSFVWSILPYCKMISGFCLV